MSQYTRDADSVPHDALRQFRALARGDIRIVRTCPVHGASPQIAVGNFVYCAKDDCNERMEIHEERVR